MSTGVVPEAVPTLQEELQGRMQEQDWQIVEFLYERRDELVHSRQVEQLFPDEPSIDRMNRLIRAGLVASDEGDAHWLQLTDDGMRAWERRLEKLAESRASLDAEGPAGVEEGPSAGEINANTSANAPDRDPEAAEEDLGAPRRRRALEPSPPPPPRRAKVQARKPAKVLQGRSPGPIVKGRR